jgi:hypothetical protein
MKKADSFYAAPMSGKSAKFQEITDHVRSSELNLYWQGLRCSRSLTGGPQASTPLLIINTACRFIFVPPCKFVLKGHYHKVDRKQLPVVGMPGELKVNSCSSGASFNFKEAHSGLGYQASALRRSIAIYLRNVSARPVHTSITPARHAIPASVCPQNP